MADIKNVKLYESWKNFVKSALKTIPLEEIPSLPIEKIKIDRRDNGFSVTRGNDFRIEPDAFIYLARKLVELKKLPEFSILEKHMSEFEEKTSIDDFICNILGKILRQIIMNNYKDEDFQYIYSDFENYLYSDTFISNIFVPIQSLCIEADNIILENNLKIRKIKVSEIEDMWNATKSMTHRFDSYDIFSLESVFEMTCEVKKSDLKYTETVRNILNMIIVALRLLKTGPIGINTIKFKSDWRSAGSFSTGIIYTMPPMGLYKLNANEIEEFLNLWKEVKILDLNRWKALDIAIRRLNFTYERKYPEDKLIDYAIAFEALFLREEERLELSHKLALRAAFLLGNNKDERKQIYSDIKRIYNLRSKIVHGSHRHPTPEEISLLIPKAEEYLRNFIKKIIPLTRMYSQDKIIEYLDDKMF